MFASFGKLTELVMEELRANCYLIILLLLITGDRVIEVLNEIALAPLICGL